MAGGKRWTEAENNLLREMIEQGAKLHEVVKTRKFEGRTPRAIEKQIRKLKVSPKKFKVTPIGKAKEVLGFEEFILRYVNAFIQVCEADELTRDELERFRLIFMAAWKYRDMFSSFEEIEEVKADVKRLKELVAELLAEKKTQA